MHNIKKPLVFNNNLDIINEIKIQKILKVAEKDFKKLAKELKEYNFNLSQDELSKLLLSEGIWDSLKDLGSKAYKKFVGGAADTISAVGRVGSSAAQKISEIDPALLTTIASSPIAGTTAAAISKSAALATSVGSAALSGYSYALLLPFLVKIFKVLIKPFIKIWNDAINFNKFSDFREHLNSRALAVDIDTETKKMFNETFGFEIPTNIIDYNKLYEYFNSEDFKNDLKTKSINSLEKVYEKTDKISKQILLPIVEPFIKVLFEKIFIKQINDIKLDGTQKKAIYEHVKEKKYYLFLNEKEEGFKEIAAKSAEILKYFIATCLAFTYLSKLFGAGADMLTNPAIYNKFIEIFRSMPSYTKEGIGTFIASASLTPLKILKYVPKDIFKYGFKFIPKPPKIKKFVKYATSKDVSRHLFDDTSFEDLTKNASKINLLGIIKYLPVMAKNVIDLFADLIDSKYGNEVLENINKFLKEKNLFKDISETNVEDLIGYVRADQPEYIDKNEARDIFNVYLNEFGPKKLYSTVSNIINEKGYFEISLLLKQLEDKGINIKDALEKQTQIKKRSELFNKYAKDIKEIKEKLERLNYKPIDVENIKNLLQELLITDELSKIKELFNYKKSPGNGFWRSILNNTASRFHGVKELIINKLMKKGHKHDSEEVSSIISYLNNNYNLFTSNKPVQESFLSKKNKKKKDIHELRKIIKNIIYENNNKTQSNKHDLIQYIKVNYLYIKSSWNNNKGQELLIYRDNAEVQFKDINKINNIIYLNSTKQKILDKIKSYKLANMDPSPSNTIPGLLHCDDLNVYISIKPSTLSDDITTFKIDENEISNIYAMLYDVE